MAITNKWATKFHHVSMIQFVKYFMSSNMESQALAIHGTNAQNIKTTGTKACNINGVYIPSLPADSEYVIASEAPYAAWASGQSYDLNSEVVDADGKHWVCVQAHTSAAYNHPLVDTTGVYWKRLDKWAVAAAGNSIAQNKQAHYLICALNDGTLRAFMAYVPGTEGATTPIVIPPFDPERYVAVGLVTVKPTSGAHIFGTTALTTVGTFTQFLGPIFPDADFVDKN